MNIRTLMSVGMWDNVPDSYEKLTGSSKEEEDMDIPQTNAKMF